MRTGAIALSILAATAATRSWADMMVPPPRDPARQVDCHLIEQAAHAHLLPAGLLTRLLWTESRFQADALSPKGARGVAQFMPNTADERGLSDPFDPAAAIPQAARLLADLNHRFGNTGLAVAAYNAGSKRVDDWLANTQSLPKETENFVLAVTGHSPTEWAAIGVYQLPTETQSCLALSTSLAKHPFKHAAPVVETAYTNQRGNADASRQLADRDSQYYIGYRKTDGSHELYSRNSQYNIGYSSTD